MAHVVDPSAHALGLLASYRSGLAALWAAIIKGDNKERPKLAGVWLQDSYSAPEAEIDYLELTEVRGQGLREMLGALGLGFEWPPLAATRPLLLNATGRRALLRAARIAYDGWPSLVRAAKLRGDLEEWRRKRISALRDEWLKELVP